MQTENFKSFYHWVLLHNFSILWRRKKKDDKKTKAFYDWATTGIPVKKRQKNKGILRLGYHRYPSNYGPQMCGANNLTDKMELFLQRDE